MIDLNKWESFKTNAPFKQAPYDKRNWGNKQHSLCSFYGKLKPSLSYHLIDSFTSKGDKVLDCFCGSGTLPFEAALNSRNSYGFDINPLSIVLTDAKIRNQDLNKCERIFDSLKDYIMKNKIDKSTLNNAKEFGFNKTLEFYYHPDTLNEILLARKFFSDFKAKDSNYSFVISCMLHILHGNRPYALSRRSHPITPYSPTGEFEYKSLTDKLYEKMSRSFQQIKSENFIEGKVYNQDILNKWNKEVVNLDAIITSPPFFDSTRFYLVHWLRSWFLGWEKDDFESKKRKFVGERQKIDFTIYNEIFKQSKERLNNGGVLVFHLGKSKKKDMGKELAALSKKFFNKIELFDEDVSLVERHGIKHKGTVSSHQYLVMY